MSRTDIGMIFIGAAALILSFPPFWGGPIAMVALIPLMQFIGTGSRSWQQALLGGYVMGFIWTAGTIYWIGWATPTGLIGAVLYVPLFLGLISLIMNWIVRLWGKRAFWLMPLLWSGAELLQAMGPVGFPWNQLGNSQTHMIPLIQFASITGSMGVGFWVVILNVFLYMIKENSGRYRKMGILFSGFCLLILIPWIHGMIRLNHPDESPADEIRVSVVQGNIDPYKKWTPAFVDSNFIVYETLSAAQKTFQADLIVWPETATPCYLRYRYRYLSRVMNLADSLNSPILTGSPDYLWNDDGKAVVYNAALLIQPGSSQIQCYYKQHLVPFSERVPLVDKMPWFHDWLSKINLDVGNYAPGDSLMLFSTNSEKSQPLRFGTAICFDSVFPEHIRKLVRMGARFIVVITNDGWFGHTSGPYQHLQLSVLRALESGRWIARCANTGISGFIDPCGRIQVQSRFEEQTVLNQSITQNCKLTPYVLYAPWMIRIMLLGCIIVIGAAFFQTIKQK